MNEDEAMNEMDVTHPYSLPRHWFALQTRSRHEKIVRNQLDMRNIEHFLPTMKRVSQWTDRKKQIEMPLFAGYCFAKFSSSDRLSVLQLEGVVRVVGSGGRPESIPDDEIESLRKLLSSSSEYICHPYFREGMLVEVISGPLKGIQGRLVRESRHCSRLVLSITLIQRAIAVEIDAASVVPVEFPAASHFIAAKMM
jgi:transcription termination/antitermination protein NusG